MNILSFFVSVLFTATSSAPNPSVAAPIMMSAIMSASTPTVAAAMATTFSKPTPYVLVTSFVAVTLSGCKRVREFVGELMRTEPKPGRKHPGSDHKFNRTWVYKEPPTNRTREDPRTPEQIAFDKAWDKMEEDDMERYQVLWGILESAWAHIQSGSVTRTDDIFQNYLLQVFPVVIPDGYNPVSQVGSSPASHLSTLAQAYANLCFTELSQEPKIRHHLQYGDDAESEMYYVVVNGLFPIYADDRICRFYQIDVARLGLNKDGKTVADPAVILPLFMSEKPLTNEAWIDEPDADETFGTLAPRTSMLIKPEVVPSPTIAALFHYLVKSFEGAIGMRFIEVQVHKRSSVESPGSFTRVIESSDVHVTVIEKEQQIEYEL